MQCEYAESGVYAAAASDGNENAVLISNISGEDKTVKTNLDGSYKVYVIDEEHFLTEAPLNASEFVIKNIRLYLLRTNNTQAIRISLF